MSNKKKEEVWNEKKPSQFLSIASKVTFSYFVLCCDLHLISKHI